ncbi:hypothetical protein HZS92_03957 [Xanthomonas citri pv. citri]|nr:hypothetical protein XAR_3136 [Xanthomonas citri pv. glycines str. 8ra]QYF37254.1 hypothetical protein HZS91_04017 [Xanthomonas citri pv. citri]QYF41824.1 hypothetical protein HZS92_03957 [Xanthomonas citri pv. citri]QYF46642.1 hypothetical protein HZS93_03996 [Xanthomonas citri]
MTHADSGHGRARMAASAIALPSAVGLPSAAASVAALRWHQWSLPRATAAIQVSYLRSINACLSRSARSTARTGC